jgi:hypothetical protein
MTKKVVLGKHGDSETANSHTSLEADFTWVKSSEFTLVTAINKILK